MIRAALAVACMASPAAALSFTEGARDLPAVIDVQIRFQDGAQAVLHFDRAYTLYGVMPGADSRATYCNAPMKVSIQAGDYEGPGIGMGWFPVARAVPDFMLLLSYRDARRGTSLMSHSLGGPDDATAAPLASGHVTPGADGWDVALAWDFVPDPEAPNPVGFAADLWPHPQTGDFAPVARVQARITMTIPREYPQDGAMHPCPGGAP